MSIGTRMVIVWSNHTNVYGALTISIVEVFDQLAYGVQNYVHMSVEL